MRLTCLIMLLRLVHQGFQEIFTATMMASLEWYVSISYIICASMLLGTTVLSLSLSHTLSRLPEYKDRRQ